MQLEGIHHITAITADGQRNLDFYVGVMGLRLVKKTVNQDQPSVYHLFYADYHGSAGADLTFFEFPGSPNGRAGAGMVHRIGHRVASDESLDFWQKRLEHGGFTHEREDGVLKFSDPEGLDHELVIDATNDPPLINDTHPEIPAEHALRGFDHVHAYTGAPGASAAILGETLGFNSLGQETEGGVPTAWEARGTKRGGRYLYDAAPSERALQGAGTVHHVAWATELVDEDGWQRRVAESAARPTEVIDRFYFRSVYFREPSGVLFELATLGPGFTVDEPLESLGEKISLPPAYEHLREEAESTLTPLENPLAESGAS